MSRVGKNPVEVPQGVTVELGAEKISVKGKMGVLAVAASNLVEVTQEGAKLWVKPKNEGKDARMMWGTMRANLRNMVEGVSKGFTKTLKSKGSVSVPRFKERTCNCSWASAMMSFIQSPRVLR